MTDLTALTNRVLEEIGVEGATEASTYEDEQKALTGLKSAHYELDSESLLRWTMSDVPAALEEPYVLLGAFYSSRAFGMEQDAIGYARAFKQIRAYVMTDSADAPTPSESF